MNRFGLESLTLDVETRIHRDTWIENADAQVEIRGELRVFKAPRREPIITGVIRTVQGTLAVAGKTFTVQQGQVLFTGGREINPSFDIVAKYQVENYQVLATVTGTAQKPELSLSSIPSLSQSDILSVLVFGKPSSQLTQGQQQGLQQQALSMAGGYAASQLGKAVAQALGLESLGINTAPGGGLGLGTYLTRNLYVSASQESSGTYGHRATMGYYLTPDLELETSTSTTQGNQVTLEWTKEY
jgi:translocation and assembly module TamB